MSDTPRYTSDPTVMSFWSAYRIYDDRLELDTRLFGHIVIPFAHLERAELRPRDPPRARLLGLWHHHRYPAQGQPLQRPR